MNFDILGIEIYINTFLIRLQGLLLRDLGKNKFCSTYKPSCHLLRSAITHDKVKGLFLAFGNRKYSFADKNNKRKIADVIKYVKIRRIDHVIWGIIPTDLKLLVSVISVSISYLIIIIQLNHVYD